MTIITIIRGQILSGLMEAIVVREDHNHHYQRPNSSWAYGSYSRQRKTINTIIRGQILSGLMEAIVLREGPGQILTGLMEALVVRDDHSHHYQIPNS